MKPDEDPTGHDIRNFQRVSDRLFRGGRPSRADLARLKALGVRTIVDLRWLGRVSRLEEEQAHELGLRYYRIPMGHWTGPREEAMTRVLEILADPESGPVYVHCRRGCDRTGAVIACYRILVENWDAERAIAEARSFGMRITEVPKRAFIRRFFRARREARALQAGSPGETRGGVRS